MLRKGNGYGLFHGWGMGEYFKFGPVTVDRPGNKRGGGGGGRRNVNARDDALYCLAQVLLIGFGGLEFKRRCYSA